MTFARPRLPGAAGVAVLLFSLSACDQINSAMSPASDLVGTWGPPTNPSLALPIPSCEANKVVVFEHSGSDLVMRSATGTMRTSHVEKTSSGWELYEQGNSNALVIARVSEGEISMNLGLLGRRTFYRCS